MFIIDVAQRTDAWHAWRKKVVTASSASVLLGRSQYKTLWRLFMEMSGKALPADLSANPFVQRGIYYEPLARDKAEIALGGGCILLPICATSAKYPQLGCSFDGITEDNIPVELKCPSEKQWLDVAYRGEQADAYQEYYPQVQHQMAVSGSDHGYLFFLAPDNEDYRIFRIERDEAMIEEIATKAAELLEALAKGKAPKRDPERDIYYPVDDLEVRQWTDQALEYRRLDVQIKDLKAQIDALQVRAKFSGDQLVNLMHENLSAEAAGVSVTRFFRSGNVDYPTLLAELCPNITEADIEKYRKPGQMQTRYTVTDKALPRGIVDPEVVTAYQAVPEGELRSAYF